MQPSRDQMTVLRILAISISVLLTALQTDTGAVTSTTGKEFTYWDGGGLGSSFPEQSDHVSLRRLNAANAYWLTDLQALDSTVKAVLEVDHFLTGGTPCGDDDSQWPAIATLIAPHLAKIAAFEVGHEPDTSGQSCFPGNPNAKNIMLSRLEERSATVKMTWPGVKTSITYGPTAEIVTGPLAQNIDWNGFDCYGPFENCFATGVSIPQVVDAMATRIGPQSSIFLISDASCFVYDISGRKTHESELFIRGIQYWQLAATHPRVKGLIGFLWGGGGSCSDTLPNDPAEIRYISDSLGLRTLYRNIGLNLLTGALPSIPAFNVPTECVITAGTTCNVNISWSSANLRLFARLVGNPDVWGGPYCAGLTSCSIPAAAGDYIFELRQNDASNSMLILAKQTKARYGSGAATGQITSTSSTCKFDGVGCTIHFTANVQNAPAATFFALGSPIPLCNAGTMSLCARHTGPLALGGPYSVTVQLKSNNQLLDQRTFSLTVTP